MRFTDVATGTGTERQPACGSWSSVNPIRPFLLIRLLAALAERDADGKTTGNGDNRLDGPPLVEAGVGAARIAPKVSPVADDRALLSAGGGCTGSVPVECATAGLGANGRPQDGGTAAGDRERGTDGGGRGRRGRSDKAFLSPDVGTRRLVLVPVDGGTARRLRLDACRKLRCGGLGGGVLGGPASSPLVGANADKLAAANKAAAISSARVGRNGSNPRMLRKK